MMSLALPVNSATNGGEARTKLRFVFATKNRDPPQSWGIFFGAIPCFALLGAISGGNVEGSIDWATLWGIEDEGRVGPHEVSVDLVCYCCDWYKARVDFGEYGDIFFGLVTGMNEWLWIVQSWVELWEI